MEKTDIEKQSKKDKYMWVKEKHGWRSLAGLALISCLNFGTASAASCQIAGTNFDTQTPLFNPDFTEDAEGWFSSDLGDMLDEACGSCQYYGDVANAIQTGMTSTMTAAGDAGTEWLDLASLSAYKGGFTAITANPKVMTPYMNAGSGSNMLMAIANSHENAFFTQSVQGLTPGSKVTMSVDVYSLLDPKVMEKQLLAMNEGVMKQTDLVTSLKIANNMTFNMQSSGTKLTPGSGMLNGNKASITVCTALEYGQPAGVKETSGQMDWGSNTTITITATADANGSATFYFMRAAGANFAPIGLDNIKIEGEISPVIVTAKRMPVCPAQPVMLQFRNSYPSGTKYSWSSTDGQTSAASTFSFIPAEAKKSYTITGSVQLPGCAVATAKFVVETKECCTQKDPVTGEDIPLAETAIFYDDFGTFLDANTYQYTDAKGKVYTVPTTGMYNSGDQKRIVTVIQPGSTISKALKPSGDGLNDRYAITNINPYNEGVKGDASGTGMGGMFVFDLSGTSCNGTPIKDLVVYEREVCGLCKGKKITFSAKFGAINNTASVGELSVILRRGSSTGEIIIEERQKLDGSSRWYEAGTDFTVDDDNTDCVVMQVVNRAASYGNSEGDFAIDDISFTVCTPPDVAVESSLTAEELLDLCTDKPLTLEAEISEASKGVYGSNIGYLFQYTYQDPSVVEDSKITWTDLSTIQSNGKFTIDVPANHPAFAPLAAGGELNVYFRVVIGDAGYLRDNRADWLNMSALSPCRAISISSIPIVAALNCASCTNPDPVVFSAEGGKKTGKKVELCAEDVSTTLSLKSPVHGIDKDGKDYYDYTVTWYKGTVSGAGLKSKVTSAADSEGPSIVVNYADVAETGTKYIVSIHDNFDVNPTPCDITDTIIVYALPKPDKTLTDPEAFCEGRLLTEPVKTIDGYEMFWYADADTLTAATEPVVADVTAAESPAVLYYVIKDANGCRSDAAPYTITVNAIPEEDLAPIEPFCQGDATAALPTSALGYTVNWYTTQAKTATANTALATLTGSTTPYTYWYTLSSTDCESEPVEYSFTVKPIAEVTVTATPECDLTTVVATPVPATATITWDPATATGATVLVDNITNLPGTYTAIASAEGYCDSDPDSKVVTFNATPDPISISIEDYLKSDGAPDFTKIDAAAAAKKSADADVIITWSALSGPTTTDVSASLTEPTTGFSATRVDPTPNLSNTDDEFYYYWVRQERSNAEVASCPSPATLVVVPILGAPSPNVHDTVYCYNSKTAGVIGDNASINQAKPGVTYELVWEAGVDPTAQPDLSTVGSKPYKVAQRVAGTTNVSAYKSFVIKVVGVDKPVVGQDLQYCAGDVAVPVSATINKDDVDYFATGLTWFENDAEQAAAPTPNTTVSTTTTYHYAAVQNYTIPSSGEVCYGDSATFDVKVVYVPQLTTSQVTYLKADANAQGSFDMNLLQKQPDVYSGNETGALINWSTSDGVSCGAPLGTMVPTPTVDPATPVGTDQTVYYCVTQTVLSCTSEPNIVKVVISDAPAPIVAPIAYCEGETAAPLTAQINTLTNPESAYDLVWYDETHTEIPTGAPTPSTAMKAGETKVSTYKYYVRQILKSTGAPSTESELVVSVYANPVLSVTNPAAVCKTAVSLAPTTVVTNTVDGMSYIPSYYTDALGTAVSPASVTESGTYYVQYEYDARVASGLTCKSTIEPIVVTIDTLKVLADNVSTCPDRSAILSCEAQTNAALVTYAWTGQGDQSNLASFETKVFTGAPYDSEFTYHLKVTAGTCSFEDDYIVKIGLGPVLGTMTISDATNTEVPTKAYTNKLTSEPYYYCSDNVTMTPSFDGDGDYVLTTPSGTALSSAPFTVSEAGVYTLSFTNQCPTKVTYTLKSAKIDVTNVTPSLEMCEDMKFTSTLNVVNTDPSYDIVWMFNTTPIAGATTATYTIEKTVPTNSGSYSATVNSHGCVATTEIGDLKVKPYIKVVEDNTPRIVPRGQSETITLNLLVPANGTLANVDWYDGVAATGVNALAYTETDVQADHNYTVKLSDPNYCETEVKRTILVDAVLKMSTELADVLCEGLNYRLTIDTTGTGAFRRTDVSHELSVYRTINGSRELVQYSKAEQGKLVVDFKAEKDGKYEIHYAYGNQTPIDSVESFKVIPAISVTLPATPTICEGEEVDLTVSNVQPDGTVIIWDADATILTSTESQTVTVKPSFNRNSTSHQSAYSYTLKAFNETCNNSSTYTVKVNVDEPLTGTLTGITPICEGDNSNIDASAYDATTYEWTVAGTPVAVTASSPISPTETTTYNVEMTRGKCSASDNIVIEVTSKPVIIAMDSVGIRSRQVQTEIGKGTGMFFYHIDDSSLETTDVVFDNLSFAKHVIYVKDENGCKNSFKFKLDPPAIVIPEFFSPNGDGQNESWVIASLAEVYPNAVVTIFDRFGKQLCQFLGAQTEGWDGTYKGTPLPSTDYWYVVEIEEIDTQYTGHFTLMRR